MRIGCLLVLVSGCVAEPPGSLDALPEKASTNAAPADPFTSPTKWYPAAGWTFYYARPLSDISGDGEDDGVVMVCDASAACRTLLVFVPLDRSFTFPGDEVATLANAVAAPITVGDVTGDGLPDLEVPGSNHNMVLEAPFTGVIDVDAAPPSGGYLLDVDDDGVLDLCSYGAPGMYPIERRLEVRYGPWDRWSGRADLVVEPSCGTELPIDDWSFDTPYLWPDVTGDGVRELYLWGYPWGEGCDRWLVPVPDRSVTSIDPATDPAVQSARFSAELEPIADQTGDGVTDFLRFPYGAPTDGTLVAGPLVVQANGEAEGTAEVGPLGANLWDYQPLGFDLDGDGVGDFVARVLVDEGQSYAATAVVHGGVDGLTGGAAEPAWTGVATVSTFSASGQGWMMFSRPDSVALVDLGPSLPAE
ncbi:MAG: hypothetical protein ABMB14_06740 [Myxococcota bacterium]